MTETRRLGTSPLHTPKLCLGGNVFGWTADRDASFAVLDAFVDGGGTLIDTADVYSAWIPGNKGGESETLIGEWLKANGRKVAVATKVGMQFNGVGDKLTPKHIAEACDGSLQRLGVEQIDLYYAHQDDPDTPQEEYMAAFAELVKAGKVATLGASQFGAARLKSANDIARSAGQPHFEILQPEYNLLARTHFEGELQDYCVTHNLGVLTYFGLASGFLTGKYRSPADFGKSRRGPRMQGLLDGKGPAMLAVMDTVAAETGASLAQIALAWLAAQDGVTAPIASATSVAQVEELLGAMDLTLSADQLERLDAAGT